MIWLSGNLKNFWHSFVLLWGSWVMWFTLLSPFCQMGEKWDVLNQISPLSIYSLLEPIPFPTNSFPYTPSHRIIGSSNWSKKTVSTQLWSPHFPIQSSYQLLLTIAVVPKEWPLDQQHQHHSEAYQNRSPLAGNLPPLQTLGDSFPFCFAILMICVCLSITYR